MTLRDYFHKEKRFIVTSVILLLCIAIFLMFPAKSVFEGIVISIIAFIILPILHVKLVLKENLAQWGLGKGQWNIRIFMTIIISFLAACGLFLLVHLTTDFSAQYAGLLPAMIFDQFRFFLLFNVTIVLFSVILYEIFFRGFVLHLFTDRVGWWAVIVQFLVMTIVLMIGFDDRFLLDVPYILVSLFAGVVAYVTRSVWYAIPFSFLIIILFNSFIIMTQ